MEKEIKISAYRNNGAKIFTGRDKGIEAREALNLNSLDEESEVVRVLIPSDTWGINPSFFGGMFEGSIKKLGTKFTDKYQFWYSNGDELNESMKRDISDNIAYVIRNISVVQ